MKAYGERQPSDPAPDNRDLHVASLTQLTRPRMSQIQSSAFIPIERRLFNCGVEKTVGSRGASLKAKKKTYQDQHGTYESSACGSARSRQKMGLVLKSY
jgi:hypothetical protein